MRFSYASLSEGLPSNFWEKVPGRTYGQVGMPSRWLATEPYMSAGGLPMTVSSAAIAKSAMFGTYCCVMRRTAQLPWRLTLLPNCSGKNS